MVQARSDPSATEPVSAQLEIAFPSASLALSVPVRTVKVSLADVSRKFSVSVVITGASLAAVTETVKVAVAVCIPSVTETVNVSEALVARALIGVLFGAKV